MEQLSQFSLGGFLFLSLLALAKTWRKPKFSSIALIGAIFYAIPFLQSKYSLAILYRGGTAITEEITFSVEARLLWILVLAALSMNAMTDKAPIGLPTSITLRHLLFVMTAAYSFLLALTFQTLIEFISLPKNERILSLGAQFSLLQLFGVLVVVLTVGTSSRWTSLISLVALTACIVDLIFGYRIVTILGIVGGVVLRGAAKGQIGRLAIPILLCSICMGIILKPIYYRLASSQSVSVSDLGTYVSEGLATYEGSAIAAVLQTTLDSPDSMQLPPVGSLLPSLLPFGGSLFGEPLQYSNAFARNFFPETPWGFGGSLAGETIARGGQLGFILSISLLISLTRLRPRSEAGKFLLLACSPFVFFYIFRSDLTFTLDVVSKLVVICLAAMLVIDHQLFQRVTERMLRVFDSSRR